jgi:hypothetical protein
MVRQASPEDVKPVFDAAREIQEQLKNLKEKIEKGG